MSTDPTTKSLHAFRSLYGREPEILVRAPGRVNLIGDHVDYAGGMVMPIAIELQTVIALARQDGRSTTGSRFHSVDLERTETIDLGTPVPALPRDSKGSFVNYVIGPIEQIRSKGHVIPAMDMTIASSIPMGGGLSSSAALEVGVILAMRTLLGAPSNPLEIALEAQQAEHDHAGTPCGIMDMYVSAAARSGHASLIDCRTNELRHVKMPDEEDAIVLITDTTVRHTLNDGAYSRRREACEKALESMGGSYLSEATVDAIAGSALSDEVARRARHVVEETERVRRFAHALERKDLEEAGALMFESHESLTSLYEVSCPELDLLVNVAEGWRGKGVHGSRMTGGGFGGCTVTLCRPDAVDGITHAFEKAFEEAFARKPVFHVSRAAAGASILEPEGSASPKV